MTDVDLNLVRTFVLLYEIRSVTKVAERLFLTQPSVSHALRRQFNDELFLRSPEGLQPTPVASSLYPRLRQAVEVITEAMSSVADFDPRSSTRAFRICATDLGETLLLPAILAEFERQAPHCRVEVSPLNFATAGDELRQGRADLVVCTPRIDAPDLERDELFDEDYVGLCAARHARIGETPTLAEFLAERHIAVDPSAGHAHADRSLARRGLERDVAVRLAHFAVLPEMIAQTSYLAVVPRRVAALFTRSGLVRTFALPLEVPTVKVAIYTYRRAIASPSIDWLRTMAADVLRGVAAG